MNSAAALFKQELAKVPESVKIEVDLSFAIADKIAHTLEKRGISQKEFSRMMGKSEGEVSRWVSGQHNFTLRTLAKISDVLNIKLIRV